MFGGMTLPGKAMPVYGSVSLVEIELKSPARIALFGMVRTAGLVNRRMRFHSTPPKKKTRFFRIGPPRLTPTLS